MQKSFEIRCVNGHLALYICAEKTCQYPSGICNEQSCAYSKKHEDCVNSSKVSGLVRILQQCARENSEQLDELVIGSINKMIKRLEIIRMEYEKEFDSQGKYLWGNKKRLYELLESGSAEQVKPKLVAMVVEELGQKSKGKEELGRQKQLDRLRESMESANTEQESSIEEIRRWWSQSGKSKNEMKSVLRKRQPYQDDVSLLLGDSLPITLNFSLLCPSVYECSPSKVRVKILGIYGRTCVGVGDKETMVKNNFDLSKDRKDLYLVQNDGIIVNFSNPAQDNHQSDFKYAKGDVLEMEYSQKTQELKISNLNKGISYTLTKVPNKNKGLHYCVYTFQQKQEWEIVE